ncbi:DUF547 domain-containing protein [uncultured Polaribacter sp.]|uniref:DUF547 domain-containing protein n=1 Tax=uncultured Polaribacter sp. TaxID=174711 RepID=UPI00260ABA77|nr:DUF547 domain-containing protein [uncultured Polaribacter sp.]
MKKILLSLLTIFTIAQINAQTEIFNGLLQKHVTSDGIVDYKSFKADESKLDTYIAYLEKTSPAKSWSENKKKAFWMNAYNAYTIKTILSNYPLKSIMNVKKKGKDAWNIPFAKVGGKTYTLNNIEHDILRKTLFDARIHVGVNCASGSCPKLGNMAFTEKNVDASLEKLMKEFVNDTTRNKLSNKKLQLSSIFDWYKGDFTKKGSLIDYLNKYADVEISKKARTSYLKYDWTLNGK